MELPEIWKKVNGWDCYEISTHGNLRRKLLKTSVKYNSEYHYLGKTTSKDGYAVALLHKKAYVNQNGVLMPPAKRAVGIHRLVAEAFIPNDYDRPHVDHIDGNRSNNRVTNLRWASVSENQGNRLKAGNIQLMGRKHYVKIMKHCTMHSFGGFHSLDDATLVMKFHHARLHREFSPYWNEMNNLVLYAEDSLDPNDLKKSCLEFLEATLQQI